jgi:beta-N-acetylhexosaminidase
MMRTVLFLTLAAILAAVPAAGAGLREMAGEMLMVGFRGYDLGEDDPVVEDIEAGRVGGVVLFDYDVMLQKFGRNIIAPGQLQTLTDRLAELDPELLIAVDQEGGKVRRLKEQAGFPSFPSAKELGAGSLAETRGEAIAMATLLDDMGFNVNFAPVVDVDVNPHSPAIGAIGRSFSADPITVAKHAAEFIIGMRQVGIGAVCKHFPGHGSATGDTHQGWVAVTRTWTRDELIPYRRLFKRGMCNAVMVAHTFNTVIDIDHPATLSESTLRGLLRDELGFDGLVITDDLQMHAISEYYDLEEIVTLAVNAGNDILLFANNLDYDPEIARKVQDILVSKVRTGEIPRSRIVSAYERITAYKKSLGLIPPPDATN